NESVDVLAVEIGSAIDDLCDDILPAIEKRRPQFGGGELPRREMSALFDRRDRRSQTLPEHRRERRGGIGRNEERTVAAVGQGRGDAACAGGFANSSFSDDERGVREKIDQGVGRVQSSESRDTRTGPPGLDLPSFSRQERTSRNRAMRRASSSTYSASV